MTREALRLAGSVTKRPAQDMGHRMPALLLANKLGVPSVQALAYSGYAAENLMAAVHLRPGQGAAQRGREMGHVN